MHVACWAAFADELRAALIARYPAIAWRVTRHAHRLNSPPGINVQARRAARAVDIWVPKRAVKRRALQDLVAAIHQEATGRLATP